MFYRYSDSKKDAADHFFYFEVPNVDETKLMAIAGDYCDESIIRKVSKPNPAYILTEKGAVLNWWISFISTVMPI